MYLVIACLSDISIVVMMLAVKYGIIRFLNKLLVVFKKSFLLKKYPEAIKK